MPYKTLWDCTLILQSVKDGKVKEKMECKNISDGKIGYFTDNK